ncbi:MAG TPA: AmmeMemoRadiSam system protein A [Pyrinomonadaceae bacterium]|nr:AmmeMemoRadiSam system protein A [Pyrinomonadaceae bacterium]
MAHTSSLVFAGVAPHPPIMVPEVGRESSVEVQNSINAMAELTARVISSKAETVVIVSPHGPLEANAFIAYDGPKLFGDFANFRAPTTSVHAELDEELLDQITRAAANEHLIVMRIRDFDLDHGTSVPLYFLQRNGWTGRVIALGYSFLPGEDHVRFGNCVRAAIEKLGRRVAFIASGDLSHRLKPDAPAGYNPNAHLFDEEVVAAIRSCATDRILNIDQEMRRAAGECGYRSMLVAIGATHDLDSNCEVISYEAPFGVGYLVAQLLKSEPPAVAGGQTLLLPAEGSLEPLTRVPANSGPPATAGGSDSIPSLARRTIETFITNGTVIDPPDDLPDLFNARAGCFVSIKTRDGDLRGCIGTIEPVKDTLSEEIIANAISAATRDPRFTPVHAAELPNLKYSVDVLSAPEPCSLDDLDPKIYGVIVEDESGSRRGLLLPNLEGIDTAEQQVEIASGKAGLARNANVKLFRFRAERYSE